MSLIVQKFGGSSVRDAERVMNVARRIVATYDDGNDVIVVVSAQGDTTDDLIEKAKEILSSSQATISQVAAMCGYDNEEHFMRQFKKNVGVTPTVYRKNSM